MTTPFPFTVHRSPFSVFYLFSVFRDQWLMVNGKWLMVNGATGGSV